VYPVDCFLMGSGEQGDYSPQEVEDLLSQSKLRNWDVEDRFFWLNVISKA